jgi:hypothetical protein
MDIDKNDELMKPQDWDLFETVPEGIRGKVDSLEALFTYTLGKAAHITCREDGDVRNVLKFLQEKKTR